LDLVNSYFSLGFFNILFAWLGMIDFFVPIIIAIFAGNKWFCNRLCGRDNCFPNWEERLNFWKQTGSPMAGVEMVQIWFLAFFLAMFLNMIFQTYLVASKARTLNEAIKLFWTFEVPWRWTYKAGTVPDWIAQFSFGFYGLMLTSMLIGLVVMVLTSPEHGVSSVQWEP